MHREHEEIKEQIRVSPPLEMTVPADLIRPYPQVDVGLLFGAYDPVHWGHVNNALHVQANVGMKEMWFIPSAFHRFGKNMSPLEDRVKMLELFLSQIDPLLGLSVRSLESDLGITDGKTIRVLEKLEEVFPNYKDKNQPLQDRKVPIQNSRFGLVLGLDNMARFPEWFRAADIAEKLPIFFADRPGSTSLPFLHRNMYVIPEFLGNNRQLSSTHVRTTLADDETAELREHMPANVRNYISQQRLYLR